VAGSRGAGALERGARLEEVVLALGSNLGDRERYLREAVLGLKEGGVVVERVSSVYETPPLGGLPQRSFLNMVVGGRCALSPMSLMEIGRRLEEDAGRERTFSGAPRTLDVDLLFFGRRIVRAPGIRVPHARWKVRSFVVRPLLEILPGLRDPETGWRVEEIAALWPMEPKEIRLVVVREEMEEALDRCRP
jgi:2-amino-4-hydroxy-6-hydroxymethyldihydropteridine diphosphokinase